MKKPKTPAYNIAESLRIQHQISGPAWLDYYGIKLQGDVFEDFARCAHAELPPSVKFPVVYQSLQTFAGQELTPAMGDEAAWRLAGNLHRLRAGKPVFPWKGQPEEEPVPFIVEGCGLGTRVFRQGKPDEDHVRGAWMRLYIVGGLPAGRRIVRFWSWKYAKFVRADLGFSKWDDSQHSDDPVKLGKNFPLKHFRQLVQMRFLAALEADLDPSGPKIVGDQVRATASMKEHNRSLLKRRVRQNFQCPMSWDKACHFCPVGYDTCPVACHKLHYVARDCPGCHEKGRPFDPESPSAVCVDCWAIK
jgi:hypothetical protein